MLTLTASKMRLLFALACIVPIVLAQATLKSDLASAGILATLPGDSTYDKSRESYNRRLNYKPAAITFPTSTEAVSSVVKLANKYGLSVSARSGGHSYVANGLGGRDGLLVIDFSKMKTVTVNASSGRATAQPGIRLGDFALALNSQGRATSHGTCPYVGLGGHAAGGYGFTSRQWGLVVDNFKAATVVLANGTIAQASETINSDLFWAVRGAASSFGIVTSLEIQTYAQPSSVTTFAYSYELSEAASVSAILNLQTFVNSGIPAALGIGYDVFKGETFGTIGINLRGAWYGPSSALDAILQPLLSKFSDNDIQSDDTVSGSYIKSVETFASPQPLNTETASETRETSYYKSLTAPALSQSQVKAFMKYFARDAYNTDGFFYMAQIETFGGSNSRINTFAKDATSFAVRDSLFTIQFIAESYDESPTFPQAGYTLLDNAVNSIVSTKAAGWKYGAYMNYIDSRLANWQELYYGSNYARLVTLKKKYDPRNVFKSTFSIEQ